MVLQNNVTRVNIYLQKSTKNQSFLNMHYYLKDKKIENNAFFLILIDPDLAGIDPRDPRLNLGMKQKVLFECKRNYWYFLREVVKIPEQGGSVNSGVPYELHRGNLALNFCLINNLNIFAEFPRQHGKTLAVVCRLLWEFLFGTTNSEMILINKKFDDSKLNLARMKEIRAALPSYLQMNAQYGSGDKKLKVKDSVETLEHPMNHNRVKTISSARSKIAANSLGRGCTQPRQWYDEYAFIPYNNIIYLSATPAYKTASMNAKKNGAPYGIIITTTPGDLTTDEGKDAFDTKEAASNFTESWYDLSKAELDELLDKNTSSKFVYIRYTYEELGKGEQWFKEIVLEMKKDWSAIRREVLLEWSAASDNSPFTKEDLNIVGTMIMKQPIRTATVCKYYTVNIYRDWDPRVVPIIGVDVSGGFQKDSSTITIIDSKTTNVIADFNCNYISPNDLANVIFQIVSEWMPNAVVNIERNGGFGASVLSKLIKTPIKKNLYYEIKERIIEESFNGTRVSKKKEKRRVFGFDETKNSRNALMEILRQRMDLHKDKFTSPILYEELKTLEVKKNGRIEHSVNGHDDQVFSYLLALYVWYEGKDIMERWNIQKTAIKTDEDCTEALVSFETGYKDITSEFISYEDDDSGAQVQQQLQYLNSNKAISYADWERSEFKKDQQAMEEILRTPYGREAYARQYSASIEDLERDAAMRPYKIPDAVFQEFYS